MDLLLLEHQTRGDGVHGRIAPALVEEAAVAVEGGEVVDVGVGSQPVEVANLEVGPLALQGGIVSSWSLCSIQNSRKKEDDG